jgi:hypothetical protein
VLYSLIETAKVNGFQQFQYFLYLFDKLPHTNQEDDEQLRTLLPMNLNPDILEAHQKRYLERGVV